MYICTVFTTNKSHFNYLFFYWGGGGEQQPWRTNSSDHGRQIEREPKLFCSASRDFVSRGSREREPKLFLAETFVERVVTTNAAWKRNDVETRSLEDKSPTTDGWRMTIGMWTEFCQGQQCRNPSTPRRSMAQENRLSGINRRADRRVELKVALWPSHIL